MFPYKIFFVIFLTEKFDLNISINLIYELFIIFSSLEDNLFSRINIHKLIEDLNHSTGFDKNDKIVIINIFIIIKFKNIRSSPNFS